MSTRFSNATQLLAAQGLNLGVTDWLEVTQARVNLFAEATGDQQWIHVDPERAASGPFGGCIAHGYLTLALANLFMPQLMAIDNLAMGVNYGTDRVRFPAVVKVGARVRGQGQVVSAERVGTAVQVVVRISIEIEGTERPGCVVDTISRYTFHPTSE